MMVIGVDTHKRTHTHGWGRGDTGQLLGDRQIAATMTAIVRRSLGQGA